MLAFVAARLLRNWIGQVLRAMSEEIKDLGALLCLTELAHYIGFAEQLLFANARIENAMTFIRIKC
jgi:hypothetical protein